MDNRELAEIKEILQKFDHAPKGLINVGSFAEYAWNTMPELIAEVERLQAVNEQMLEALELAYGTGPKTWYDRDNRIGRKIEQAIRKAKGKDDDATR